LVLGPSNIQDPDLAVYCADQATLYADRSNAAQMKAVGTVRKLLP
jgi:hypothetical protein